MQQQEMIAILDEASLRKRWGGNQQAKAIESQRARLRLDDRPLNSLVGGSGPYDGQTIAKAVGGSKGVTNCLRLCQLAFSFGAGSVVELGTNLGISSAYLALGARDADGNAIVRTGDCSPARLSVAANLHRTVGLNNVRYYPGFFEATVDRMLKDAGSIGVCFIDGDHTYDGTWKYFRQVLPVMRPRSLVIFDDIDWSDGMRQFWAEASSDSRTAQYSFQLDGVGYIALD
jgi:Predicted O-methyltransferase